MSALALGWLLGAASVFVAQYVYVRRQQAQERESLMQLRSERAALSTAMVVRVFAQERRDHR